MLAYVEMPARWLRLVPWALTAVTVYLNVVGESDPFAVVAHAVLPGLWVLAVASIEHVVRRRLALDTGTRMDSVRASRWLLAPIATGRLWRRMVLWETRSYPAALSRERDRMLALTDLQDAYGRIAWRWKAPRRDRALYRLGELTPTALTICPAEAEAVQTGPSLTTPSTQRPRTRRTGSTPASRTGSQASAARRSMDELRAELHTAIEAGRIEARPSAEAIRKLLACAPSRARQLREATAESATLTVPAGPAPLAAVPAVAGRAAGTDPTTTVAGSTEREGAA